MESLTPRERQVADLVAEGYSNAAIARLLGIAHRTAKKHVENTYAKCGLSDGNDSSPRVLLARHVITERIAADLTVRLIERALSDTGSGP